jgi:hypothetical protein
MKFFNAIGGRFLFPKKLPAFAVQGHGGKLTVNRAPRGEENPVAGNDWRGLSGVHRSAPAKNSWRFESIGQWAGAGNSGIGPKESCGALSRGQTDVYGDG